MNKLINNTRLFDKEYCNIIENIVQSYDTYIWFKWVPLRPVVGLAKAKNYNENVSIDIHEKIQDFIIFTSLMNLQDTAML